MAGSYEEGGGWFNPETGSGGRSSPASSSTVAGGGTGYWGNLSPAFSGATAGFQALGNWLDTNSDQSWAALQGITNPAPAPAAAPPPAPGMGPGALSGPGPLEDTWAQYGSQFFQPGRAAQWYDSEGADAFGQFGDQSMQLWNKLNGMWNWRPDTTNRADEAYQSFVDATPNFDMQPTFGSYYEHAADRLGERFNDEAAARGMLGSSSAMGEYGDAMASLEAERANRESDFDLARLGEERAWLGLGGALGRGADLSSATDDAFELDHMGQMGRLGLAANEMTLGGLLGEAGFLRGLDTFDLTNRGAGFGAAGATQDAEEGRIRGQYNDLFGAYSGLSGMAGDTYDDLFSYDSDALDAIVSGDIAGAMTALGIDERDKEKFLADLGALADAFASFGKGAQGVGAVG